MIFMGFSDQLFKSLAWKRHERNDSTNVRCYINR